MLAVFNLLPIPPLDGWHALSRFCRMKFWRAFSPMSNILFFHSSADNDGRADRPAELFKLAFLSYHRPYHKTCRPAVGMVF
jgi:membrane-associated protease RseP (regulator of RpoE activity)